MTDRLYTSTTNTVTDGQRDGTDRHSLSTPDIGRESKEMRLEPAPAFSVSAAAPRARTDHLFLIADDLTGALDTAAQFARRERPIDVLWNLPSVPVTGDIALTSGSRELDPEAARTTVARRLVAAPQGPSARAFMKIDSLLRGNPVSELAVWLEHFQPRSTIIAPAFPAQGRVTRDGLQCVAVTGGWEPCATDLVAGIESLQRRVTRCRPGDAVPEGLSIWDAETDADLRLIVANACALEGRLLWCGSAGLAQALAVPKTESAARHIPLARPILGLIGTDHAVTAGQLATCADFVVRIETGDGDDAKCVADALDRRGIALVQPVLASGLARDSAAQDIESILGTLANRLTAPATLLVSGGETLQALCRALGAQKLVVTGEVSPGIPLSHMVGGRFDGVTVISKSGAFGAPDLFQRLLDAASDQRPL